MQRGLGGFPYERLHQDNVPNLSLKIIKTGNQCQRILDLSKKQVYDLIIEY
ncbi:MAG: hypothetical protein F6K26_39595 [Moorea sp. SIO2I5]|nr:hypothetical protein [Moorena sp. SIO2I5]